jgi:hypothetical protein
MHKFWRRCQPAGQKLIGQACCTLLTMQILQRASEDQEKLREIVRDLKIHCDQVLLVGSSSSSSSGSSSSSSCMCGAGSTLQHQQAYCNQQCARVTPEPVQVCSRASDALPLTALQVHCAPPLDVFNDLLRLCNYWHDGESLHKASVFIAAAHATRSKQACVLVGEVAGLSGSTCSGYQQKTGTQCRAHLLL